MGADNSSTTYSGVIASTGDFVKQGSGTLTLLGHNSLTGTVTIDEGQVTVDGSLAAFVVVNAGGTLGGTGRIGNSLLVNLDGVVAPGQSIGTLTIDSTGQQTEFNGTLEIEIDGLLNDVLSVEGPNGLRFGDSALIRFVLGDAPTLNVDYGFLNSDLLVGFDGDVDFDFLGLGAGMRYTVFERDADLFVRFEAFGGVPLPGTVLLAALGLAALGVQRRRCTAQRVLQLVA